MTRYRSLLLVALLALACGEPTRPAVATRLAFLIHPDDMVAGDPLDIRVAVQDADGNTMTTSTAEVTLAFEGAGELVGDVTASAVDGIVEFDDVAIQKAGIDYRLKATAEGLSPAISAKFDVVAGPAARVATDPIGTSFKSLGLIDQVVVRITDAYGNIVTAGGHQVTMAIGTNPSGGTLSMIGGTPTSRFVLDGTASFSGQSIDKAGAGYTLAFTAPDLEAGTTNAFTITHGDPAKVTWTDVPATTAEAGVIMPVIRAALRDASDNLVTDAGRSIKLSVASSSSGGSLVTYPTSQDLRTVVDGIATFNGVRLDRPGSYTLQVASQGFTATSEPITVTHAFARVTTGGGPTGVAGPFLRAEDRFACSLSTAGVLHCWGGSVWHAMGVDEIDVMTTFTTPTLVVTDKLFRDVSAGVRHSCAVTVDGAGYCWGNNSVRQLGNGDVARETQREPAPVAGGHTFVSISAGNTHSCGVTTAGAAYCWGDNGSGQLGVGDLEPRATPTVVAGGLSFLSVSASSNDHTCGITTDFLAYCWGLNDDGQLGDGSTARRTSPVPDAATHLFRAISAGHSHSCATRADAATYCWGANTSQQLGDGNTATGDRTAPSLVTAAFTNVSAGWAHSCGINGTTAMCWGDNAGGQLGDGGTTERNAPAAVSGSLAFAQLSAGRDFTCGVTTDQRIYCWGRNDVGQLGDASTTQRLAPSRVFP